MIAWHKSPTTPDVTSGIASALESVLSKSGIDRDGILYLSIGTTVKIYLPSYSSAQLMALFTLLDSIFSMQ